MMAMLIVGYTAHAQQMLPTTPASLDVPAMQAARIMPPGAQLPPTGPITPDPMISILPPGVTGNQAYWDNMRMQRARTQGSAKTGGSSSGPIVYTERERKIGQNDVQSHAERIRRFGTGRRDINQAFISGNGADAPAIRHLTATEDDSSIPLANLTGISGKNDAVRYQSSIDNNGSGVSDFDFYKFSVAAGTVFDISITTDDPFGDLLPFAALYDEFGNTLVFIFGGGIGNDAYASFTAPITQDLFLLVGGFDAFIPINPFVSGSGSVTGLLGSEGNYDLQLRTYPDPDVDFYTFHLDKGDVFGAAALVEGSPRLEIFNVSEMLEKGVTGFGSFADPASPLPINGNGAIDYIVEKSGTYAISLAGALGPYSLELGVYRPEFEREKRRVQVIWLDYNGGPVDVSPWVFGPSPNFQNFSPFRAFLPNFGLPDNDKDVKRITRKITHEVRDNLYTELDNSGVNRNLGVVVLGNDGTGTPNILEPLIATGSFSILGLGFEVSVVEVSGTIAESGIGTIGIASTIDPGNFSVNDAALVLLDVLSAPATGGSANGSFTLNDVILAPGVSKEEMVATVIGNITAHEAGHYLGNFHTDGFTAIQTIMDQGPGGLFNLAGIGPSGIFGAADQTDVSFITDLYAISEGFSGDENTAINTAFALSYFPFLWSWDAPQMPGEIAEQLAPRQFASQTLLNQSVPNSLLVGGMATIEFQLAEDANAVIELYDLAGNKVGKIFEGAVKGGESKTVTLNAGDFNLKPGVYVYKLDTPEGSKHRKIVVKE